MTVRYEKLGDVCAMVGGGTPARTVDAFYGGSIPWVTPKDMKTWEIRDSQIRITDSGLQNSATRLVPTNSVLVVVRSGVLKHTVPVAITRVPVAINQDMKALLCTERADPDYVARFVKARSPMILKWVRATTADNFPIDKLRRLEIPLPSLSEQRRLVKILDKADALRAKRLAALAQLNGLTQSIFLDVFGDPATNPKAWPRMALGDVATKFSDGPFGSNLKTEHYTDEGVRVIRLQNIGAGEFLDDDKAYVSERHFASLAKHECVSGDVLVGTLGDPNLRACVQPEWLKRALNKADCVQVRPNERVANASFLCTLLNLRSVERLAQDLVLGQTRLRISMGRLRGLHVPIPPVNLQTVFARHAALVSTQKRSLQRSLAHLDALFASLQHRAFRGAL